MNKRTLTITLLIIAGLWIAYEAITAIQRIRNEENSPPLVTLKQIKKESKALVKENDKARETIKALEKTDTVYIDRYKANQILKPQIKKDYEKNISGLDSLNSNQLKRAYSELEDY